MVAGLMCGLIDMTEEYNLKNTIHCNDCYVVFEVAHNETTDIVFCSFCGSNKIQDQDSFESSLIEDMDIMDWTNESDIDDEEDDEEENEWR